MNDNELQTPESASPPRTAVAGTVIRATVAFFIALALAVALYRWLPGFAGNRADAALASGNVSSARFWYRMIRDEETRTAVLNECDYRGALALQEKGEYGPAAASFAALGSYRDSADRRKHCEYALADALASQEQWLAAEERFTALAGFSDSLERADACRYRRACLLSADPDTAMEAFSLLYAMGDYQDAPALAGKLAVSLTGIRDEQAALEACLGLTPEESARRQALTDQRSNLPEGVLALGFAHTVGLRCDGTVLACGDDSFGQCDVGQWKDVLSVTAGAYHTVALLNDGTLVATGRNSENQCDVQGWTDVVSVTCCDYATVALRRDGTLLCTGYEAESYFSAASGWTGIREIAGGSYSLAALRNDGSLLLSHESAMNAEQNARGDDFAGDWSGIVALGVNTGYVAGLKEDGSVICAAAPELQERRDLVAVSAGANGVLALTSGGTVCASFFRPESAPPLSQLNSVCAICAGGTHYAFLKTDGTVVVLGDGSHGETDTSAWNLLQ